MKKIFELIFTTDQVSYRNLLFSSKELAQKRLEEDYYEGAMFLDERILFSCIFERRLF